MKTHKKHWWRFFWIVVSTVIAGAIALPPVVPVNFTLWGREISTVIGSPRLDFSLLGRRFTREFSIRQGLDIQGGMQVVLQADMSSLPAEDRLVALESAREVILRRVDLFGIAEPLVQTSVADEQYRLLVELPGLTEPEQALQLVGQTAQLEFALLTGADEATSSAGVSLLPTGLTGSQLKRSLVQFDQTTSEPIVALEFNDEGRKLFADITTEHTGELLAILLDKGLVMAPRINTPIVDGQAIITGGFSVDEAKQLSIQLNAGALPVPISVLEQRTIGPSLGAHSVRASVEAGFVGIGLVMLFMILIYKVNGLLASLALILYAVYTVALYKILGITLTVPGIAGLLLSVGMAVDANILIFERMKEELRLGKPFAVALELGFGRAWDSIKDANLVTIITALVLINPLNLPFLNSGGMVRGFGITLLLGVCLSLFTGIVVTRTFMRLFLKETE
ncbi:protein translocase subunit SecD [Candidatus Woesebacteria bacterium]|nr:protein translocase subunit SecD [Candidatus Woesebacteria bacterium]